jgi:hypothetical protein
MTDETDGSTEPSGIEEQQAVAIACLVESVPS